MVAGDSRPLRDEQGDPQGRSHDADRESPFQCGRELLGKRTLEQVDGEPHQELAGEREPANQLEPADRLQLEIVRDLVPVAPASRPPGCPGGLRE